MIAGYIAPPGDAHLHEDAYAAKRPCSAQMAIINRHIYIYHVISDGQNDRRTVAVYEKDIAGIGKADRQL